VLAAILTLAYTLLDEALPSHVRMRLLVLCSTLLTLACGLTVLLYVYYGHELEHLPPPARLLADTLRYGLPAVFLVLVADAHRRALRTDSAATAAEALHAQMREHEIEQQLGLLQAQIEPHFLFNVLGNVRRLYRARPQDGADAIANLMGYLRAALPQMRSRSGTLGDELDLARTYLELCRTRMGERLAFTIEAVPALRDVAFPPMLLLTLVENAIKHGIEPVGAGHIRVHARTARDALTVEVRDDGAGFRAAGSGGTGIGLVNIQRQLSARYAGKARLVLEATAPRGAVATIRIPLSEGLPDRRAMPNAV
jgi:LytS/YehU family sensor histidine kinase